MNNFNNKNDNNLNNKNNKIIFGNIYQNEKKISKGFNGTLYKVLDKRDKKFYALKIIEYGDDFNNEIEVMKKIKSKYVIELKDNFYDKIEGYCIVMELCDGDLRMILKKHEPKGLDK